MWRPRVGRPPRNTVHSKARGLNPLWASDLVTTSKVNFLDCKMRPIIPRLLLHSCYEDIKYTGKYSEEYTCRHSTVCVLLYFILKPLQAAPSLPKHVSGMRHQSPTLGWHHPRPKPNTHTVQGPPLNLTHGEQLTNLHAPPQNQWSDSLGWETGGFVQLFILQMNKNEAQKVGGTGPEPGPRSQRNPTP